MHGYSIFLYWILWVKIVFMRLKKYKKITCVLDWELTLIKIMVVGSIPIIPDFNTSQQVIE